jgi:hypothetical protein
LSGPLQYNYFSEGASALEPPGQDAAKNPGGWNSIYVLVLSLRTASNQTHGGDGP